MKRKRISKSTTAITISAYLIQFAGSRTHNPHPLQLRIPPHPATPTLPCSLSIYIYIYMLVLSSYFLDPYELKKNKRKNSFWFCSDLVVITRTAPTFFEGRLLYNDINSVLKKEYWEFKMCTQTRTRCVRRNLSVQRFCEKGVPVWW